MGKTTWSGQQTVTGEGTWSDRPGLTEEEDGAAAHRHKLTIVLSSKS